MENTTPDPDLAAGSQLPGKQQKGQRKWPVRVLILLVILLLLVILYLLGVFRRPAITAIQTGDMFPDQTDAEDGFLPMSEEELLEQMQKEADESYFSFKINSRPVFADGNSAGTLGIENPNYNVYPMVVQITLDSTGEIIYDSGGIMPGQHIAEAKLAEVLSKGEYEATATLYAYDPDTLICQGQSQAVLKIIVEN